MKPNMFAWTTLLAVLSLVLAGCGGGGGSGGGGSSPSGPPAPPSAHSYHGTVIESFGSMTSEGPTNATVDLGTNTITFHSNVEGTVTAAEPVGTYRSADGIRLYDVTFNPVTLRLTFKRAAGNANTVTWQLVALTAAG